MPFQILKTNTKDRLFEMSEILMCNKRFFLFVCFLKHASIFIKGKFLIFRIRLRRCLEGMQIHDSDDKKLPSNALFAQSGLFIYLFNYLLFFF